MFPSPKHPILYIFTYNKEVRSLKKIKNKKTKQTL